MWGPEIRLISAGALHVGTTTDLNFVAWGNAACVVVKTAANVRALALAGRSHRAAADGDAAAASDAAADARTVAAGCGHRAAVDGYITAVVARVAAADACVAAVAGSRQLAHHSTV